MIQIPRIRIRHTVWDYKVLLLSGLPRHPPDREQRQGGVVGWARLAPALIILLPPASFSLSTLWHWVIIHRIFILFQLVHLLAPCHASVVGTRTCFPLPVSVRLHIHFVLLQDNFAHPTKTDYLKGQCHKKSFQTETVGV